MTSVETSASGTTTVTVTPANIADAYEVFEVNTTVNLDDAVTFDPGLSQARIGPSPRASLNRGYSIGAFTCSGGNDLTVETTINLNNPAVNVQFDAFAKYLRVTLAIGPELRQNFGLASGVTCRLKESSIPKAFIPIAGPFGIELKPGLEIKANGNVKFSHSLAVQATVGAELQDRRARAVLDSPRKQYSSELEAAGSISIAATYEGALSLGGRISAGVSAGPEVTASLIAQRPTCLKFELGTKIGAFVAADAFINSWRADLASAVLGRGELAVTCASSTPPTTTPPTTTPPTTTPGTPTEPVIQPGQLTNLTIGPTLRCRVDSPRDGRSVFYGSDSCGTHLAIDGTPFGAVVGQAFRPVSGPQVSGQGSRSDPKVIRTTVEAGSTGVFLDQVDTFVDGSSSYTTTIAVRNTSADQHAVILYRAADCYLNQSDFGVGELAPQAVSCTSPNGRRISWTDLTGGADRYEGFYSSVYEFIRSARPYDNTAQTSNHDNGAGLSWSRTVPAGALSTFRSRFSLDEPASIANARSASPRALPERIKPGPQ